MSTAQDFKIQIVALNFKLKQIWNKLHEYTLKMLLNMTYISDGITHGTKCSWSNLLKKIQGLKNIFVLNVPDPNASRRFKIQVIFLTQGTTLSGAHMGSHSSCYWKHNEHLMFW